MANITGYFITGTDTSVGKTLVSCALLQCFAAQGRRVAGFKPVAAGVDADGMNDDAKALLAAGNIALRYEQVNPYCLREAIAPHIAAQLADTDIDLTRIVESYTALRVRADMVIVEGAGGFVVPLNANEDTGDLARHLGLPIILVVGMRLGCLNHALLTVEAIAARGLKLAGWVANRLDKDMARFHENVATLQLRIRAPMLGIVPYQEQPDAREVAKYLDLKLMGRA